MKKLTILIAIVLSMVACTSNSSPDYIQDAETAPGLLTRSQADDDELENSSLLNDLRSFNDSLIVNSGIVPNSNSPVVSNQVERLRIVDALGYVIGYGHAQEIGLKGIRADWVATIYSVYTSLMAAEKVHTIAAHLPSNSVKTFQGYATIYSAVLNSANYNDLATQQYLSFGGMSMFNNYKIFFNPAIDHNLMVNKYRSGMSDGDIVTEIFSDEVCDIIYSDDFQSKMCDEIEEILAGDIDYLILFSDRKKMTTSLSQKKAGETLKLYIDAVSNNHLPLEDVKLVTYHYMNSINSTSEINPTEKITLFKTLPITIASDVIWISLSNMYPVY